METQSESPLEQLLDESKLTYASIMERIQAVTLDGGIILVTAFLVFSGLDSLDMTDSNLKPIIFVCLFILYDPLLIAFAGGTLGHKMVNLTVKDATDPVRNINIVSAVIRFVVKSLLGWVSLLTITGNKERRAIHDWLGSSIVLKKPRTFAYVPDQE